LGKSKIKGQEHSMPDSTLSVVIAGGGFCGAMTLVHLVRIADKELNITLINKGYPLSKGIAYKSYSNIHLLNVEARNLSAFPDQPDHFVEWCLKKDLKINKAEIPTSYLPRNLYGNYLEEIFKDCINNIPPNISIRILDDEVVDVDKTGSGLTVSTLQGKKINADRLLLATGNSEPGPPVLNDVSFLKSKNYFSNPWNENAILSLPDRESVLIVGTGLTMVDVVLGLREKNFNGKIIALSPHGYNILPHRKLPPQKYILDEISPPYELEKLFRLFYRHIREARQRGLPGETVVDAIRSKTQEIWQLLSLSDRKKFMVHLRHLWGVARHRLPVFVHSQIQQMIRNNTLEIVAGRIINISENKNGVDIKIRRRKDQSEFVIHVARVINCTGPQTDIRKQQSMLYDSLLKKGIIRSDDMNLGIDATREGKTINSSGTISESIFAIGSLLKGKLWESTAVPELRKQALQVAELFLEKKDFANTPFIENTASKS
jgi:uncharacterized NAD(P)/FAD-binding protein YdhS